MLVVFGGLLAAWSGVYNIAASSEHFTITRWFFTFAMRNSVGTHSLLISPPSNLDDPDLIALGAGHYQGGCSPCHGAPGDQPNPIVMQMLPAPPLLQSRVSKWRDRELFWIVKNGIKYTGMPAWAGQARDDEVWSVVAFLRHLPRLNGESYQALAYGSAAAEQPSPEQILSRGPARAALAACARCHGDGIGPPSSSLVPRLAGQKERYLALSLKAYARGARQSGIMEPVAAFLDEQEIARLASLYSRLEPAGHGKAGRRQVQHVVDPDILALGETLATKGDVDAGLPPCMACHDRTTSEAYPLLSGQSAAYLVNQLKLWRAGQRSSTALGAIMTSIGKRMEDRQIKAVAAYFSSRGAMDQSMAVDWQSRGRAVAP